MNNPPTAATSPTQITPPPPPPAPDPPSLVQRIAALEDQLERVFAMMKRDREYMDELRTRIGLS